MSGLMPSARITSILKEIEARHGVAILYACESGSRGWGFASQDSDYDVRFIYQNPRNWYLSIDEKRDVIELPINDELDINGWDLRKALRLLRKSNPALFEWLSSPIVYRQDEEFVSGFLLCLIRCNGKSPTNGRWRCRHWPTLRPAPKRPRRTWKR